MNDSLIQNQNNTAIQKSLAESEAVIKSNESLVGMGLWSIGNELKIIRDTKSYQEKGYNSFEEYTKNELNYSKSHTYNFITIAEKYNVQSIGQIGNFGINKLLSLSQLPEPERNDFIEKNNVDDMSSRELQAALKEKKQAEEKARQLEQQKEIAMDQNKHYVEQVYQLQNEIQELSKRPPKEIIKTVEKEVMPRDYHGLKDKVFRLENNLENREVQLRRLEEDKELLQKKIKLTEKEAGEYDQLKKQINLLRNQKKDFEREIAAVTELSGLVVKVETFLKQELAPIKYSRAIEEQKHDDIVQQNLKDIINRVYKWCDEMSGLLNSENHYNAEVIDYAE